ncbi:DUF1302 domain-containing protein [Pseudomonas sp. MAP12]|uniref:DUF1302 domain-containing protein n=1 Tax=Geopseudomonas aromaticivorans TaxID=2849492 RepID=A0ABS6MV04_9GAMM|nr:DUF1302 domain-containing protein [Pseudomonas aromaticivorans]MBV2132646.1 DUF1302 domain-containing protein [Pseudomonas aromaticivorans]
MSRIQPARRLAGLALGATLAVPAGAVPFNLGAVEGQFDSSLSLGASWSTAAVDRELIGANNGGRGLAQSGDDGRLNFKRGETFAKRFTGVHGLELRRGDSGLFLRGRYWYDVELQDEGRPFKDLDDHGRRAGAQAAGAQLLDAFVYRNYRLGERPGSVRLGQQVVSWGESRLLPGGIDVINPLDVAARRRPGAQLRDGLLPVNLLHVAQNLSDALALEAFYQLEWEPTAGDNCGSFFAQSDLLANGCVDNLRVLNSRAALSPGTLASLAAAGVAVDGEGVLMRRAANRNAADAGQFGVALRYFVAPLDTQFAGYFINYHSRAPLLGATAAGPEAFRAGLPAELAPLLAAGKAQYFLDYPEDIRLYGLSFATTLAGGSQWRGELSYRPNAPLQLSIVDVLNATRTPLDADLSPLQARPGEDIPGYRRHAVTQLHTGLTHIFDNVMGASRLTLDGELGWSHVGGLNSRGPRRYGRDPVFGPGPLANGGCEALNAATLGSATARNVGRYCANDGFTTRDAWGYRLRAVWEYDKAIAGIDLRPNLGWAHDVRGYSPAPDATFEEGRKAISLGLDADYLDTYTASLAYTDFFGGRYSTQGDRDFLALELGLRF